MFPTISSLVRRWRDSTLFKQRNLGLLTTSNGSSAHTGFILVRPALAGAQGARCEVYRALAGIHTEHMGPGDLGDEN